MVLAINLRGECGIILALSNVRTAGMVDFIYLYPLSIDRLLSNNLIYLY